MSIVDKAVEELKKSILSQSEKDEDDAQTAEQATFALDHDKLRTDGFFVPSEKPQRLAQELRAVKRRLLRRLKFYQTEKKKSKNADGKNVILVTSTSPAEGKTFSSVNLALSLALEDQVKVLLIDSDIPRPRVLHHLGVEGEKGLTDLLEDETLAPEDVILKDQKSSLSLLSQGTVKGQINDLYAREEFADLLQTLSKAYSDHLIIIDAPPILAAPGTSLLAEYVDEVVFVIRANQTPEPAVIAAIDEVMEYNQNVSLLLNYSLVPGNHSQYGSYDEYYYKENAKET